LPIVWPFLRPGYFPTHDGEWAVIRLAEMHRELKDLQIPPRWSDYLNHGYGYPLFLFNYPFPYFLADFFHFFGFGLVISIKIVFILSIVLSGLSMFVLARKFWGNWGGVLSVVFYLYLPFRLVDLFVRGSIGESLAFVFYPLLFFLGLNLLEKKSIFWILATAAATFGLILTHNVMALVFFPFFLFFLFFFRKPFSFLPLLSSLVLGFSLAAFFWLPALLEKKFVVVGGQPISDISQHFVNLSQLILPSWGYNQVGQASSFSFQIGWVHLLAFIACLYLTRKARKIFLPVFISTLVLVLLMLPYSLFFWQHTPPFSAVDFPWRLLGLVGFFVSFLSGAIIKSRVGEYLAPILVALVISVNASYAKPIASINKPDSYYASNDATTTSFNELMPVWVQKKLTNRPQNKVEIITKKGKIKSLSFNSRKIDFLIEAEEKALLQINTIYFPGWRFWLDKKEVPISYDNPSGLIRLEVPQGKHEVRGRLTNTPVRTMGNLLSLLAAGVFAILWWRYSTINHKE
jgi:hypothetical protein